MQHHPPQPYRFGYEVKDKEGSQFRHEEGDGHGTVKGSYGYTDDKGTYREVEYVADKNGFRAKVKTNEPGTANQDPANVKVEAHPPAHHEYHNVKAHSDYTPIVHKIEVAPIRPVHHFQHFKSYNLNNFSPIHRYSYKPSPVFKFRPHVGHSSYNHDFGKQMGGYQFHVPHYRNLQGFGNYHNMDGFGGFEGHKNDEIEKIIEELKNKQKFEYSGGLKGLNNDYHFSDLDDNDFKFKDLGDNNGEFKGLNNYEFKDSNNRDYHFKEFRNIGNHKYSSS